MSQRDCTRFRRELGLVVQTRLNMSINCAPKHQARLREPFPDETATLANYKELASMYCDFIAFFAKWGYLCALKTALRMAESRLRARRPPD